VVNNRSLFIELAVYVSVNISQKLHESKIYAVQYFVKNSEKVKLVEELEDFFNSVWRMRYA